MPRLTLSDGRTLEMRPIYVSDRLKVLALQEAAESNPDRRYIDYLRDLAGILEGGMVSMTWEGSLLDMPEGELLGLMAAWRKATEEEAVPPESGATSSELSPSSDSAEPTDSPSE